MLTLLVLLFVFVLLVVTAYSVVFAYLLPCVVIGAGLWYLWKGLRGGGSQ